MEQLHFVSIAKAKRENWLQDITQEERAVMGQHFEYVEQLSSEGKVIFAGACLDGAFGIVVFKAESEEAARKIYENDPVVKAGILDTEFHLFKVGKLQNP